MILGLSNPRAREAAAGAFGGAHRTAYAVLDEARAAFVEVGILPPAPAKAPVPRIVALTKLASRCQSFASDAPSSRADCVITCLQPGARLAVIPRRVWHRDTLPTPPPEGWDDEIVRKLGLHVLMRHPDVWPTVREMREHDQLAIVSAVFVAITAAMHAAEEGKPPQPREDAAPPPDAPPRRHPLASILELVVRGPVRPKADPEPGLIVLPEMSRPNAGSDALNRQRRRQMLEARRTGGGRWRPGASGNPLGRPPRAPAPESAPEVLADQDAARAE